MADINYPIANKTELEAHKLDYVAQVEMPIENLMYHDLYIPRENHTVIDTGTHYRQVNDVVFHQFNYLLNRSATNRFFIGDKVYYNMGVCYNPNGNAPAEGLKVGFAYFESVATNAIPLEEKRISGVITATSNRATFGVTIAYNSSTGITGGYTEISKDAVVINLTKVFGAGNEPTKEQMDILINYTSWFNGKLNINQGVMSLIKKLIEPLEPQITIEDKYIAEFYMANIDKSIDRVDNDNLYLIATNTNIYYDADGQTKLPNTVGYLYLNDTEQKLYYSSNKYDNPKYLCDWDSTLTGGLPCEDYTPTITNDGDIIFIKRPHITQIRTKPIIYPTGDYGNPKVINVEVLSFTRNAVIDHVRGKDYFIFGEYRVHSTTYNDTPLYIWKVSKPYDNPTSWKIVDTWYHRHYSSGEGINPTREIGHFHMANYDFYNNSWVITTGDINEHCRVLISNDDGETWNEVANGSANYRVCRIIFTEDGGYWGTDSNYHYLVKAPRLSDGTLDFANVVQLSPLVAGQPTYITCLVRNPYGLLFLDRAEPRLDNKLDLSFWSFTDNKLHILGTYDRLYGADAIESVGRHGFGTLAVTNYQSVYEDGIICGSTIKQKPITVNILNNDIDNIVGNMKIKINHLISIS